MPTRNVSLTDELDRYVEKNVSSGRYANASEVVREALRELIQSDLENQAKIEALRVAIQEGIDSGFVDGDEAMSRVRANLNARIAAGKRIA